MFRNKNLTTTKNKPIPKSIICFDTETNTLPDNNGIVNFSLRLGIIKHILLNDNAEIISKNTYRFKTINEYLRITNNIVKNHGDSLAFAHNVGFDVRVLDLPKMYKTLDYPNKPPIINNRVFLWDIETPSGKISYIDTSNFGVLSVDQIGKTIGMYKGEVDFETATEDELFEYCENDVEILVIFISNYIKFIVKEKLGGLQKTIASQSLYTFRFKFLKHDVYLHNNKEATNLEREGYYGGRVEAYFIGKPKNDNYYYVDFNSMYPYVMANKKVPVKLIGHTKNVPLKLLGARLSYGYCIADVTLKAKNNAYPYRYQNKLIFPTGNYRTVLHHCELEYAYHNDEILIVHSMNIYKSQKIFESYVNFFYGLKQKYSEDNNKTWRYITKLYLNSLYGKFGQLKNYRKVIGEDNPDIVWRMTYVNLEQRTRTTELSWFGKIYREYRKGETSFSNPAIAGSITAYARHRLYTHYILAGKENTFYCDTDSLIVNEDGYNRLLDVMSEDKLGYLKLEKESDKVEIRGPKDYKFGSMDKTKGVPKKAIKLGSNKWEYLQFQGFIQWLNNGASGPPTGEKRIKRRVQKYNKGIVTDSGKVIPIHF